MRTPHKKKPPHPGGLHPPPHAPSPPPQRHPPSAGGLSDVRPPFPQQVTVTHFPVFIHPYATGNIVSRHTTLQDFGACHPSLATPPPYGRRALPTKEAPRSGASSQFFSRAFSRFPPRLRRGGPFNKRSLAFDETSFLISAFGGRRPFKKESPAMRGFLPIAASSQRLSQALDHKA
jgi:hypothetical protein